MKWKWQEGGWSVSSKGGKFGHEWHVMIPADNGDTKLTLCYCGVPGDTDEEKEALARLIGSAPDLLVACKAFAEAWEKSLQLEKTDVALKLAKEAIEKAEKKGSEWT